MCPTTGDFEENGNKFATTYATYTFGEYFGRAMTEFCKLNICSMKFALRNAAISATMALKLLKGMAKEEECDPMTEDSILGLDDSLLFEKLRRWCPDQTCQETEAELNDALYTIITKVESKEKVTGIARDILKTLYVADATYKDQIPRKEIEKKLIKKIDNNKLLSEEMKKELRNGVKSALSFDNDVKTDAKSVIDIYYLKNGKP